MVQDFFRRHLLDFTANFNLHFPASLKMVRIAARPELVLMKSRQICFRFHRGAFMAQRVSSIFKIKDWPV